MALTQVTENGVTFSPGTILQVQFTQFTGTSVFSTSGDTVVTDLTVNITPSSTSSKVRIEAMVTGEWSDQNASHDAAWFFYRDTTKLAHAVSGSRAVSILMGSFSSYYSRDQNSTPENAVYCYYDSPSTTSQITYKVGYSVINNHTWYLNRTVGDLDTASYNRGISHISVMEIAG